MKTRMATAVEAVKAIGITRVSSEEQRRRYGIDVQRDEIAERAETLGYYLVDVWEFHESATKADRRPLFEAMLHRLMSMGNTGEVQAVIFSRPDRLGRDGESAFFYYVHLLEQAGQLQVHFARDDVDPDDSYRNFKLFMEAFKATRDAATIRANTMSGRRRRAESGKLPTGNVPWPFDYASKVMDGAKTTGLPTVNPERAAWVRKWLTWILHERLSLREVCRRMQDANVIPPRIQSYIDRGYGLEEAMSKARCSLNWTPSSIKRNLTYKAVLGEFYAYQDDESPVLVVEDDSLAILSHAEYEAIQSVLKQNKDLAPRNTKYDYTPLQGFVYCHCGRKAAGNTTRSKVTDGLQWSYFRCQLHLSMYANAEDLWRDAKELLSAVAADPTQVLPTLTEYLETLPIII